jgi:hypothetical protein
MILTPSPSVPQAIKPAKSAGSFYASQAMNVYRSVRSFAYVLAWSSTAFGIIGTHTLHTHALQYILRFVVIHGASAPLQCTKIWNVEVDVLSLC